MRMHLYIFGLLLLCSPARAVSFSLISAVSEQMQGLISAKDFGAVGDGIADDTQALHAAFYAATDIYIPAGIYRVTATLILRSSGTNLMWALVSRTFC